MAAERADVEVEDLLTVILVLVAIWLVLEIAGEILEITLGLLGPLRPAIGVIVLLLIVLWLLDTI